jgi:zinc protease
LRRQAANLGNPADYDKGMLRLLVPLLTGALALFAADAPRKAFSLEYDTKDYPNGLRLITIPTGYPNVVSVYIVVQTGSRNEVEPGKSGFAHLFEHMMFRGTQEFPPEKYEAAIKEAGASSNAYTSDDLTVYHTTFSKEDLDMILRMEADRFQNLKYSEDVFKTESLAVLGEYNKNSASPTRKLDEVIRETAFDKHTYRHTTMGFLKDVQDMPNQYEYSKLFFDRYYRPEYTTIVVAGDVKPEAVHEMVVKYWGEWKRGGYKAEIPAETPQKGPRTNHVDWPMPTLPWMEVAFRGPAFSEREKDMAALDLISFIGFSESSDLYQRLVIKDQKVDYLAAGNPDHVDPYLFGVSVRVKKVEDMEAIKQQVLSTLAGFKDSLVSTERLDQVKKHLRYKFALELDNTETIADIVARYVALTRSPESINRVYEMYQNLTPEDVRRTARKYFVEDGRTIVTLTGSKGK